MGVRGAGGGNKNHSPSPWWTSLCSTVLPPWPLAAEGGQQIQYLPANIFRCFLKIDQMVGSSPVGSKVAPPLWQRPNVPPMPPNPTPMYAERHYHYHIYQSSFFSILVRL